MTTDADADADARDFAACDAAVFDCDGTLVGACACDDDDGGGGARACAARATDDKMLMNE